MRNHIRSAATALALLTIATMGCSGGGGGARPALTGSWEYVSGALFPEVGTLTYLELREDGTGEVFGTRASNLLGCGVFLFAPLSADVLQIDIPALEQGDRLMRYEVTGDTLTLTDVEGAATRFTRTDAIPDASRCARATETGRAVLPDAPGSFTALTFDGTNFYYGTETDVILPVNATTFATGTPITTQGSFQHIFAMDGADFWAHCGCGGSPEAQRTTPAGVVVDLVETGTGGLAHDITIRAGTWDGSRLWLYGEGDLLRVNSGLEPDQLDSFIALDFEPEALAFEGGTMWGVVDAIGPVLISFDPLTGEVNRTITLPAAIQYRGVVVTGSTAYLLAEKGTEAEIVTVTIP